MTKDEFREAMRDAVLASIEADIADYKKKYGDEPHVFSAEHEAKMRAIFDSFEKKQRRRRRTRRALVAAACVVFVFTCVSCTVPKVRNSVAGFFVQVFGDHTEYTDPAVTKECIEEEYGLVPVPLGFEVTEETKTDTSRTVTYTDKEENIILLRQIADKSYQLNVDNEHGSFSEYELNGITAEISLGEDGAVAAWVQDGYFFSLVYQSEIDLETFESWLMSVQKE